MIVQRALPHLILVMDLQVLDLLGEVSLDSKRQLEAAVAANKAKAAGDAVMPLAAEG
jgi:hypothetical protein